MSFEDHEIFASQRIPDTGCAIITSSGNCLSVWREGNPVDIPWTLIGVNHLRLSSSSIPDPRGAIPTGCDYVLAIWRECRSVYFVCMAFEAQQLFAADNIPEYSYTICAVG